MNPEENNNIGINYKREQESTFTREEQKEVQQGLNSLTIEVTESQNISDTLKSGQFDYEYLLRHKSEVTKIRLNDNIDKDIILNIKKVISQKIQEKVREILPQYNLIDKNIGIGVNNNGSMLIERRFLNEDVSEDKKEIVIFTSDVDIFDLENTLQPTQLINGDIVETGGAFFVSKEIGVVTFKSGYVTVSYQKNGGRDSQSGGPELITKVLHH